MDFHDLGELTSKGGGPGAGASQVPCSIPPLSTTLLGMQKRGADISTPTRSSRSPSWECQPRANESGNPRPQPSSVADPPPTDGSAMRLSPCVEVLSFLGGRILTGLQPWGGANSLEHPEGERWRLS
jgi:hypothetical protein